VVVEVLQEAQLLLLVPQILAVVAVEAEVLHYKVLLVVQVLW
jgi:hypothetical protein